MQLTFLGTTLHTAEVVRCLRGSLRYIGTCIEETSLVFANYLRITDTALTVRSTYATAPSHTATILVIVMRLRVLVTGASLPR